MNLVPFPTMLYPGAVAAWAEAEEKAQRQAARKRKAEADRARAAETKAYCEVQLSRLKSIMRVTKSRLHYAQLQVDYDEQANRFSVVVVQKIVDSHIKERDKLLSKVITADAAIIRLETQLAKAEYILAAPV